MTLPELVILLVVAAVCGGIGQKIGGHGRSGCLTSTALHHLGAAIAESWELDGIPVGF